MGQKEKLLYLEGLRGLAAYGVFLVHFLDGYWEDALRWPMLGQHFNIYVALFFILSGRILTASVLVSKNIGSIAVSVCKRPWRLGLPLLATTVLNALVAKIRYDQNYSIIQIFVQPWYFLVFNSNVQEPVPGVGWTMYQEFAGSMVVYITTFLILYFDSKRAVMTIFAILIGFTIFTHTWVSYFIVGLMIAVYKDRLQVLNAKRGSRDWFTCIMIKITLCLMVFVLCFDSRIGIGSSFSNFLRSIQVFFKFDG